MQHADLSRGSLAESAGLSRMSLAESTHLDLRKNGPESALFLAVPRTALFGFHDGPGT